MILSAGATIAVFEIALAAGAPADTPAGPAGGRQAGGGQGRTTVCPVRRTAGYLSSPATAGARRRIRRNR